MILDWEELSVKLQDLKLPERTRIFAIDDEETVLLDTKNEINTKANEVYGEIINSGLSSGVMNYISSVFMILEQQFTADFKIYLGI